jgi:hypothetical protein
MKNVLTRLGLLYYFSIYVVVYNSCLIPIVVLFVVSYISAPPSATLPSIVPCLPETAIVNVSPDSSEMTVVDATCEQHLRFAVFTFHRTLWQSVVEAIHNLDSMKAVSDFVNVVNNRFQSNAF